MTTAEPAQLTYQTTAVRNQQRGRLLLPAYLMGCLVGDFATLAILLLWVYAARNEKPELPHLLLAAFVSLVLLAAETLGLSAALWLRQRVDNVRFRRPMMASILGSLCGILSVASGLSFWILVPILLSFGAGLALCSQAKETQERMSFLQSHHRRYAIAAALILIAFFAAGYLSAWMSRSAVEDTLARKVAVDIYQGQPFKVLDPRPGYLGQQPFTARGYHTIPLEPDYFPWGEIGQPKIEGPFQVSGTWRWCAEPQYGGGSKIVYFCFFGYLIQIGEPEAWAS